MTGTTRVFFRFFAVAICSLALLTTGCSNRRSEQRRIEGDTYLRLGKHEEAIQAYRKAEEINPKNAMAKVGLARCFATQKQVEEALEQFQKAIALDPTIGQAYVESVYLLLSEKKIEEAAAIAQKYLAVDEELGGILNAFVKLSAGSPDEAITLLEGLRTAFPNSVDVHTNLAAAFMAVNRQDEAEKELRTVLDKLEPRSVAVRMLLIDLYKKQGKTREIIKEIEELLKDNPDDSGLKLNLAMSQMHIGQIDEAQKTARDLFRSDANSGWVNYVLGACLLEKGQYSEAVTHLKSSLEALPNQVVVSQKLALARARGRSLKPEAPEFFPTTSAVGPTEDQNWQTLWKQAALARLVQGRQHFLQEEGENITETLLLAALFSNNLIVAEELEALLPSESPLHAYMQALKKNELQPLNDLFNEKNGTWKEEDEDRKLLRENAYGFAMANLGARSEALQKYSVCMEKWPDNAVAIFNTAQMFRRIGMSDYAANVLQKLLKQYPENIDARTLLYIILREGGSIQKALQTAQTTYILFPNSQEAIANLAQAYVDSRKLGLAKDVLERGIKNNPDDASLQLSLGSVLLQAGDIEQASTVIKSIDAPPSLVQQEKLLMAYGEALKGNWQNAVELLTSDVPKTTSMNAPQHAMLLICAYLKTNQLRDAAQTAKRLDDKQPYKSIHQQIVMQALGNYTSSQLDPQSKALAQTLGQDQALLGDYAFAVACKMAQLFDPALTALIKVDSATEQNTSLMKQIFAVLRRAKAGQELSEAARKLAQENASNSSAWLGLATVLASLDDVEGQDAALDKAIEVNPKDPDAWSKNAIFFEHQKDYKNAIACYRQYLKLRPDEPIGNNNLAYCLLLNDGDLEEALQRALKANEKRPANPSILHTLGLVQLKAGQLEESRKNLGMALSLRPVDPTLMLDYGQLLIELKLKGEGKNLIQIALKYADMLGIDFDRRAEAEEILERL